MTKLCSVCGTENRDDAQFCRACGTTFALPGSSSDAPAADAGATCVECGFHNKPGVRYCANCGVGLVSDVAPAEPHASAPAADDPFAGLSPPPISYPSFAAVEPYPPAPAPASSLHDYPPSYDDDLPPPDIPDPDAEIAVREQEGHAHPGVDPYAAVDSPSRPSRTPLIAGIVVLVLTIVGGSAWWFLGRNGDAPAPAVAASAPALEPPAPLPVEPASAAANPVPIPVEPAASAPDVPASTVNAANPALPPGAPPTTAAPLPQAGDAPVAETNEADAKRAAADKTRREKGVRDKAEREAKTKALADQREQAAAAAAAHAEQDAQARRRAEDTQRSRPVPPLAPTQAPQVARTVREICAGRGTIGESICQSRECGNTEHFGEAICKQVRDAEDRRRNLQN